MANPPYLPMGPYIHSQLCVKIPYPTKLFTNQTIIVTGSSTGMGLEAARQLVRLDAARVILAVRSLDKGHAAARSIATSTKREGIVEVWELNLASYTSVQSFAARVQTLDRLDDVVENAGILPTKWAMAEDNEATITVNVVNTMLLLVLLIPKLRETSVKLDKDTVLTFTGSFVHWMTHFNERKVNRILKEVSIQSKVNMDERYFPNASTEIKSSLIPLGVLSFQTYAALRLPRASRRSHRIQETRTYRHVDHQSRLRGHGHNATLFGLCIVCQERAQEDSFSDD